MRVWVVVIMEDDNAMVQGVYRSSAAANEVAADIRRTDDVRVWVYSATVE